MPLNRLILLIFTIYILTACQPAADTQSAAVIVTERPALATISHGIQLAWFYKPPRSGDLNSLFHYFDTFILTKNDERQRDTLKAMGVDSGILRYLRLDAIQDPGSCTAQPFSNQVADQIGDFCQISAEHEDWFLLDTQGNRIEYEGYYMMDPANQAWREFWLERASRSEDQAGWDGIFLDNYLERANETNTSLRWDGLFLDNVTAEAPIIDGEATDHSMNITHERYQEGVESFLEYLSQNYFKPEGLPVYANLVGIEADDIWFSYLQYIDGVMAETWAVDWQNRYHSVENWNRDLLRVERAMGEGKSVLLVAQGERDDLDRQAFAFASYMLIANDLASFRYANYDAYDDVWLYDNYSLELVAPLGQRYYVAGEWRRDFEFGRVSVDPFFHIGTIEINSPTPD